jgi:hypothetical protein
MPRDVNWDEIRITTVPEGNRGIRYLRAVTAGRQTNRPRATPRGCALEVSDNHARYARVS